MPRLPFGDIGPCELHWGYYYHSGYMPLVITPYLGRVMLRIADTVTDIHEEGKGVAPIDSFFEGTTVELEVPMTRSTLIQLSQTIGWQKMGSLAGPVLRLDNIAGEEMYAYAHTIVIKPLCNNVADPNPNNWIELYKCHPYREIELGFDRSGQRIHLVKFKVFPSRDSGYEGAGGGGQFLQEGMQAWTEDFRDDFCDAVLGPEWTQHGLDINKTITLDSTPPCWVTISILNNVNGMWWCNLANQNLAPKMYMPLGAIGPCHITTKLLAYGVNIDTYAGIFIGTHPTTPGVIGTNYAYLFGRAEIAAGLTYDFQVQTNCSSFDSDQPPDGGPFEPIWLRIDINADQEIRFKFSTDGTTWLPYCERGEGGTGDELVIPNDTHPAYDIPHCYVGLYAKNIFVGGYRNIAAPFEFFEIESYA